ncbi:MAG: hypothetical protein RRY13_01180 [Akkermansia sp.]
MKKITAYIDPAPNSDSPTNSPPNIKYGSGGERVALAAGGASGSRLNRFHRRLISPLLRFAVLSPIQRAIHTQLLFFGKNMNIF